MGNICHSTENHTSNDKSKRHHNIYRGLQQQGHHEQKNHEPIYETYLLT